MIIKTASFKNLNGHLNPSLSFAPGVNIITGVNGSGKTSVLNGIAWTLSPSLVQGGVPAAYRLANLPFDEIDITYTVPKRDKPHKVLATREEEYVAIEVEGIDSRLSIPIVEAPEPTGFRAARNEEENIDFIARHIERHEENPVLRHLSGLPGPLYLPMDRRWIEERSSLPYRRARRSTTAGHVPASEVLDRVSRAHRREQARKFTLNEELRNEILTAMFDSSELEETEEVLTVQQVNELKTRVGAALHSLELTEARQRSDVLFAQLQKFAIELGGTSPPEDVDEMLSGPHSALWLEWVMRISPIASRLQRLMPIIETYEEQVAQETKRSTDFLLSVNSFLSDNGKMVEFLADSELIAKLPNGDQISGHLLASGELQLLILFTFLYFSFEAPAQEFPVLVDEPELSLHIAWQNRYVNSVRNANANAQFIIATHSPEIAGPVEENIIDISPNFGGSHVEV